MKYEPVGYPTQHRPYLVHILWRNSYSCILMQGENTYLVLTRPVLPQSLSPSQEGTSEDSLNFNDEEQMASLEDEDEVSIIL